jgi:hypothetical protein
MATGITPSPPRTSTRSSRGSRIAFWFAGLGGAVAIVLFCALMVFVFGQVYGVEICPETLERRSFAFLEIPLVGIQIRGSLYNDVSGDLEKHLASTNLVPQPPATKKSWHVVYVIRGLTGMKRGDPEILARYLDAKNGSHELAWLEWTKAHPQHAAAVWRGVCDLAIAAKYTAIPDVLEVADGAGDVNQTSAEVTRIVKEATKK